MSEEKHTPGPWLVSGRCSVRGSAKEYIARANWFNGEANARLISAAPELLEALIEVTASLAWNAHGECRAIHDGPIMPSAMAIEVAKAAIAKAKGEA